MPVALDVVRPLLGGIHHGIVEPSKLSRPFATIGFEEELVAAIVAVIEDE